MQPEKYWCSRKKSNYFVNAGTCYRHLFVFNCITAFFKSGEAKSFFLSFHFVLFVYYSLNKPFMRSLAVLSLLCLLSITAICQKNKKKDENPLLKELSASACKCIDSISVTNKTTDEVSSEVHECIDKVTSAYQLGSKLMGINLDKEIQEQKNNKKQINISINTDKNSSEYKEYYYQIERYLMDNCEALKEKAAAHDIITEKSFSDNKKALEYYHKGKEASEKDNHKKAIEYYKKAVDEDSGFVFAWDNLGLCYRKAGDFDNAIFAYEKSLSLDSTGQMPLQNIAVAYLYKKEYQKAITAYQRLSQFDNKNPEVYYGIGQIYAMYLNDHEKGLGFMCKAYNLYIEANSPYRTDAEKVISVIFAEMKKQGKEDKFYEILKANNISAK